jgi:hypothetical protein
MQAVERYKRVFGPLEHNVTIGGVEFVFVDAQALDGKDRLLYPSATMSLSLIIFFITCTLKSS